MTHSEVDVNPLQEVNKGEVSKVLSIVQNEESPSLFGDDDALLSLAPGAVEVSSYSGSQSSDKLTISISSRSLKSSELRDNKNIGSKIRFDDDDVSKVSAVKLDFDSLGLIGRETQISTLRTCFDRIGEVNASGSPQDDLQHLQKELVLISGASGCGKTRTVKTLKKHMQNAKIGGFVEGKFEMNTRDEPYSGISKAAAAMCQKVTCGDQRDQDDVRESISKALHDDEAQLLVHLVPELSSIISTDLKGTSVGRGMDVDELDSGIERLKHAFRTLIRIFCQHFAPLVLFLDDLQWADVSSLQMIDYLISDEDNESSLMIIGTYRSDEVDENSLLHSKILVLRDKSSTFSFRVTEMDSPIFDGDDVVATIKALFSSVKENDCRALAEVCMKRTLGNPYFVLEFLKTLYHEGLVEYDDATSCWTWDLPKIEDVTMSTANVVVLLQDRMRRLSKYAQMFLKCASYLGSTFRNATLEIVWKSHDMPMTVADTPILPLLTSMAVKDSFIEDCGSGNYRWVHDKVQEAAFSLLGDVMVSQFEIGKFLYFSLEPSLLEQDLFAVVDLINTGETGKSVDFARANLQAAEKALRLSAFKSAASYASHGIALLEDTDWSTERQLKLRLYSVAADSELTLGKVHEAERYIDEVLERDDFSTMETLSLAMTKMKAMSSVQLRFNDAVHYCLKVLRDLDFKVTASRRLVPVETLYALMTTVKRLKKVPKDFHKHIGVIIDPRQKAIVSLIAMLNYVAFSAEDHMLAILAACKIVDMTLKYGLSEYSGESIATIGGAVNLLQQDYTTVQNFMELALAIQDTVGRAKSAKTTHLAQMYGLAWTKRLPLSLPFMAKGYTVGMEMGDTVMGIWNLVFLRVILPFYLGRPLDQVQRDASRVCMKAEEVAQHSQALVTRIFWQMVVNLIDPSISDKTTPEGEILDPRMHDTEEAVYYRSNIHQAAFNLLLFFSDYEAAAKLAIERGDFYPKTCPGVISNVNESVHRAIILYAAARQTKKTKFKKAANKLRKRVAGWQKAGNPNVRHFVLALDAERAALSNKSEVAKAKYHEAISVASENGYLQYEALFNERYADYLLQQPSSRVEAEKLRSEAIRAYREWGAYAKVAQMMGES